MSVWVCVCRCSGVALVCVLCVCLGVSTVLIWWLVGCCLVVYGLCMCLMSMFRGVLLSWLYVFGGDG